MEDTSEKYPWMKWNTAHWLKDTRILSPATRGIWCDACNYMHANNRVGHIRGTVDQLARLLSCTPAECEIAIQELESTTVADVSHEEGLFGHAIVTLTNRRQHREWKEREDNRLRQSNKRNGASCHGNVTPPVTDESQVNNGGSHTFVPDKNKNKKENKRGETRARACENGVENPPGESDSEAESPHFSGDENRALSASERITHEWELKRVETEIDRLKSKREGGYPLNGEDKLHWSAMKERRAELLALLGMKV